ncbi:Regulator of chromosome condensation family protein isoform 2 [Hibiscus syriacus]|uniref:Regulator of chromosome condensation family protein isoform 2 n=1 Tax=Hibiscus syriacus TaxID=106335 RepID=A0A6A2Z8Z3_HIBSY|nr:Regulator of chromosome condensation family protein isoform 2 [Hibiscus syriacus]
MLSMMFCNKACLVRSNDLGENCFEPVSDNLHDKLDRITVESTFNPGTYGRAHRIPLALEEESMESVLPNNFGKAITWERNRYDHPRHCTTKHRMTWPPGGDVPHQCTTRRFLVLELEYSWFFDSLRFHEGPNTAIDSVKEYAAKRRSFNWVNQGSAAEQPWLFGRGDGDGTRLQDEHLPRLLNLPSLSSAGSVSMLACGGAHVVALTSGGKVLTWGRGNSGQLGHGDIVNSLLTPKPVMTLESYFISQVSAGWSFSGFVSSLSCTQKYEGCVFTCGDGSFGQLGHGDYKSHCSPVKVSFFVNKNVEQIACGMRHSLVLSKDSSGTLLYGFGSGKRGQLAISIDRIKSVNTPEITRGFDGVEIITIAANGDHSAALSADRELYTWGRGFGSSSDFLSPRHLPSSSKFSKVALGWNHALVLSGEAAVLERVPSLDGTKVVEIAAGAEHSAVEGAIKTWGWGEHGQLGLGSTSDESNPRTVSLGDEVVHKDSTVRVYCGSGFTYAIRSLCSPP